jgi:hypothetical protein
MAAPRSSAQSIPIAGFTAPPARFKPPSGLRWLILTLPNRSREELVSSVNNPQLQETCETCET